MFRISTFFIYVFSFVIFFSLTNAFADENVEPIDIEKIIAEGNLKFPTADGAAYIQGTPEYQRSPDRIIGTSDFEKMRDLPTDSQDYQLGRKVGWILIRDRNRQDRYWICTGFLVGPDLFMTNHHCIHDEVGLLPVEGARIYMDYYHDQVYGGITAYVSGIVRMDALKDYALLRLASPIGNTYGWLELDTTTVPNYLQSVKIIQHPDGRSKEIARRNSEIFDDFPLNHPLRDVPFALAYLADTEAGSSGSPVFLRDGTSVIGIHHTGWSDPFFNAGSLMSHIVPEIQQYLPDEPFTPPTSDPTSDLIVEAFMINIDHVRPHTLVTLSATVKNQGSAPSLPTRLLLYDVDDPDPNDIDIGFDIVPQLNPNETAEVQLYHSPMTVGIYNYTVCVEPVDNERDPNNNCSTAVTLTVSDSLPVFIYWIDSGTDKIQRANLDGSNVRDLVTTGLRTPTDIEVVVEESLEGAVYWIDSGTDKIQRTDFAGFDTVQVVETGLRTPTSIAVDRITYDIYWTDSGTDKIQRANLNGSNIEDLVTTGLSTPTSIAVDPYSYYGKMYWTDSGTDKIQRANLDGSNIEDLVTTGLRTPTSIAVDLLNRKMYWTDSGTDKIQRANLDGSNIEDLVTTGLSTPTSIAVDPEAGKMYWIDSGTDKIQRANLDGSNIEDIITTGLRTPTGIALSVPQVFSDDPPPDDPPPAPGSVDVNGDGRVNVIDLAMVALFYGTQVPPGINISADVNDDGTIDLSDLVAVAGAIDAAENAAKLSGDDIEVVLEALVEQVNVLEGIGQAPAHSRTSQHALLSGVAYRNVDAAFKAAKHLATDDIHLGKWMPTLKELRNLLTEMQEIPDTTALLPNYPNPFNPETWIPYYLSKDADVILTIHNIRGVLVRTLTLGHQVAGVYKSRGRAAYWDGKNQIGEPVASGVYFYTLTAGEFTATRKLLITK